MESVSVDQAIAVVTTFARELGHDLAPSVIADRSNLVLRLDASTVARVAMATSITRVGMISSRICSSFATCR